MELRPHPRALGRRADEQDAHQSRGPLADRDAEFHRGAAAQQPQRRLTPDALPCQQIQQVFR